jgi:hypothetical protein
MGRRTRKQVIERQHRVRFATPEIRLQLDNRIAATPGDPVHGAHEQAPQALGEIGTAEEFDRATAAFFKFDESS